MCIQNLGILYYLFSIFFTLTAFYILKHMNHVVLEEQICFASLCFAFFSGIMVHIAYKKNGKSTLYQGLMDILQNSGIWHQF